MKHVLITGAGGFVGHHLLEHVLLNTDWVITATDSFHHHGITDRITEVFSRDPSWRERVRVISHDLTVPWSDVVIYRLATLHNFGPVDTIFNVASESHVDRSIGEPLHFAKNNTALMMEMLELARRVKPRVFMQLSTDEVYGAVPMGRPSIEWDPILPSNPYSASKAAQEAFGIAYWRTYDVPLVIVNCMNVFGERQDPEKFIPKAIGKILCGETVQVYCSGGKPGRRHWLHARNLSDAMCYLSAFNPLQHMDGTANQFPDRYNITGDYEADNLELAQHIAEVIGVSPSLETIDASTLRPGHGAQYALDGTKLAQLGWRSPVDFWSSLERTLKWSVAHPEWLKVSTPA